MKWHWSRGGTMVSDRGAVIERTPDGPARVSLLVPRATPTPCRFGLIRPLRPPRVGALRCALLAAALALALAGPATGFAEDAAPAPVLDWETGAHKSYLIPALEIPSFLLGLNVVNRYVLYPGTDYDSDWESIKKNLQTVPVLDKDPFNINQLGHPYQGSMYYGFARSTGLNFWESAGYTLMGSFLWRPPARPRRPPSTTTSPRPSAGASWASRCSGWPACCSRGAAVVRGRDSGASWARP